MDFERAMETQRRALLRLLTGLMAVVVMASFAPAVSMMPRWVHRAASTWLMRIESAVDSLVYVAATVLCGYRGTVASLGAVTPRDNTLPDGGLSTKTLLRRIATLRAKLNDLPRTARRAIKRLTRTRTANPIKHPALVLDMRASKVVRIVTRIERPPDKPANRSIWRDDFSRPSGDLACALEAPY